jgi:predicted metal-dependent HD superfamily phosphohydrolase
MSNFTENIRNKSPDVSKYLLAYAERALINLYEYPKRPYHNWGHVQACLIELDTYPIPEDGFFKDLIAIAIYYHDCIYDPKKDNNEEMSAIRAFIDLTALGFTTSHAQYIYDLIMLTRHKDTCNFLSGQVLMDIDMAILGKNPVTFIVYEQSIGQEYLFLPRDEYRSGRIKFLQSLIDKEFIYQTEYFRDKYEKTARENIQKMIKALTPVQVTN